MVQEVKKAFRVKYSKINLSNERLEAYAAKWASKIENEEAIEEFLNGLDVEPLEEIAKLDDALRAKAPKEPKEEEPKPEEPSNDMQKQIDELKSLIAERSKSDLKTSRSKELDNLPEALKATLKFVPLDSLSDDDYNALKTDLNAQAEVLKLDNSKNNPRFPSAKQEGNLTASEKEYLESKKKKS